MDFFYSLSNKIKPPCGKECKERSPTCHSTCQEYKKYKDLLKTENAKISNLRNKENIIRDYTSTKHN